MTIAVNESKYLTDYVKIKEVSGGFQDKIFSVKGLPRDMVFDRNGQPQEGFEISQTGDGALVVFKNTNAGGDRLQMVDRYIEMILPRDVKLPRRIPNAQQPGDPRSGPLYEADIPHVSLPIPKEEEIEKPRRSDPLAEKEVVKLDEEFYCDEPHCGYKAQKPRALKMHKEHHRRKRLNNGSSNNKEPNI
jgi:hypothetical protein